MSESRQQKNSQSHHNQETGLSHSMVHYLLTVHKLKEERGYARVTDIANELGLSKGSVSTAITNLKKREYLAEEMGTKFLSLTEVGHLEVHRILSSRTLLYYFLKDFLKTSEEAAQKDSCLMEHLMSSETREKFFNFMHKMACKCRDEEGESLKNLFETSLDICSFKSAQEFEDQQYGDSFLTPDTLKK